MKSYNYIIEKQRLWGVRKGLPLIGSQVTRGAKTYTQDLKDNIYQGLHKSVEKEMDGGDGGELLGYPCKMQAVHSSATIAVNVFQYWKLKKDKTPLLKALSDDKNIEEIEKVVFEEKFPVLKHSKTSPNIDIVLQLKKGQRMAIECKFTEAYGSLYAKGLKKKYLSQELAALWQELPHVHELAKTLSPRDDVYKILDAVQLTRHLLGLMNHYQGQKKDFSLYYIWYDALGVEGAVHRNEIEKFSDTLKADGVDFYSLSWQELIIRLGQNCGPEHKDYCEYITGRYL